MVNPIPSPYNPTDFTEGVFVVPSTILGFVAYSGTSLSYQCFPSKNKVKLWVEVANEDQIHELV